MIRVCQPARHYEEENEVKWSINASTSCRGNNTDQISCNGIYGNWAKWTTCDKSCVHKNQQSIRTRQRRCDDTITDSGLFFSAKLCNDLVILGEICNLAKSIEMEVCQRPICEKCANFVKPCAGVNVECVDLDESKTCVCKKPFTRDNVGECSKCNALRPFAWQCAVRK